MAKGYEVTVQTLNIRSGPGAEYDDLGNLSRGQLLIPPANCQEVDGFLPLLWVAKEFLQEVEIDVVDDETAPVPATPAPSKVIYQSDLTRLFGNPSDPAPHLKLMDFSFFRSPLSHVKDYMGNYWSFRIWGHYLLETPLRQALENLISRGFGKEFKTYHGCLNIRPKTGGGSYSTHAWGLAVDVNAGTNGYGRRPTLSAGFVKCFTDAGFTWGGVWSTPDGMHFQIPRV